MGKHDDSVVTLDRGSVARRAGSKELTDNNSKTLVAHEGMGHETLDAATPSASAAGLALTLPETVSRSWRPRKGSNLRPTA
jgi:hypothetical protein